ncbi:hypothetical protein TrVGV298_010709 [Trichoderma virens]|nr:hypothetical protein TrVGV298_010709 [Trichoderma virens]
MPTIQLDGFAHCQRSKLQQLPCWTESTRIFHPPDNDDNVYTLGSIGGHNVVITCLPKGRYGTNSAATVAKNMIGSFPSIKFELLVGIGGGIPSKVRLGDVVVSAPTDQYPGVVQWDLGKAEDGGKFRRIGALNSPPNALLKVLSKLESENEMQGSKIPGFLDEMKQKWPKLYPKYFWNASLRDPQGKGSEGAANTTADSAIDEPRMRCPDIHYGLIASGNQVIKDATVRDCLDGDLDGNVLCIEMEAAGLMNNFPCLVVRGICDYADSSKNKDWQEFLLAKIYLDTLVDKVTIADVRMAVAQLPKQMAGSGESQRLKVVNQAYELAWERINGQQEGFRDIATRVLAWIACAKRPLHTWELQHALAVKVGMKEIDKDAIPQVHDMISFCAGLVTIDEESNVIRPVHYTTQEYIKTKKSDWFPNPEIMITETCITYLSFTAFEKCFLDRSRLHYLLRSHDFYLYASRFWGEHTRLVGKELDKNVLEFLMNEVKIFNAYHAMQQQQPGEYRDLEAFPAKFSLHHAVHFGFDKAINLLLKKGCDINGLHGATVTPLRLAISEGNIDIAELLLDNGAHLGFESGHSPPYLRIAMDPKRYNEGFVKKLIERGIELGEDISGYMASAAKFGHEAIVAFLLQKCAMPEGEVAEILLDNGANIEAKDCKGADIEARNGNGDKPLHIAVQNSSIKAVDLLLNMGANVEAADPKGYTPLHIAVQNSSIEAADLLLNMGANVEAVDPEGYTPLHIAAQDLDVALIELLLKNGASTEALDNEGRTPLFAVILSLCREHCIEADVDVLLEYEANVDVLLKYEAKMEAIDNEGCTVLISVVEKGDIRVSEFLIQKGACIEGVDSKGRTPLLLTIQRSVDRGQWGDLKETI